MTAILPSPTDLDHLKWLNLAKINSLRELSLLELGCGSGYLCHRATEEGARLAFGMDLVLPKYFSKDSKWQFAKANLDEDAWLSLVSMHSFDLILGFDILEHVRSPFDFLNRCASLLSLGGQIVLTTPNVNSWERWMHPDNWSGTMDPQHKVLFSRYSLGFLLKRIGLEVTTSIAPMRKLGSFAEFFPQLGGQIFCVARKVI